MLPDFQVFSDDFTRAVVVLGATQARNEVAHCARFIVATACTCRLVIFDLHLASSYRLVLMILTCANHDELTMMARTDHNNS